MTGRKDPYKYVRCKSCGNIFRAMKSTLGELFCEESPKDVYIIGIGSSGCPECGGVWCELATRKEWKKSNEVKPDNVIEKGQFKIFAG